MQLRSGSLTKLSATNNCTMPYQQKQISNDNLIKERSARFREYYQVRIYNSKAQVSAENYSEKMIVLISL